MTTAQAKEWIKRADDVRRLVDAGGWQAVRQHPELGPLWAACLEDSRRHVDAMFRDQ